MSYSGASWASDTPPCGGTSKRANVAGDSLTLQFVGTAVYLNCVTGPNSGIYSVEVDEQPASVVSVDSFSSSSDCDLNWSSFGMESQLHTITVTYVGASKAGGSAATASFEFANFMCVEVISGSLGATDVFLKCHYHGKLFDLTTFFWAYRSLVRCRDAFQDEEYFLALDFSDFSCSGAVIRLRLRLCFFFLLRARFH